MLRRADTAFLWLLTLLLAIDATRAQFKIIGLLDTNSPLVKIASVPSSSSSSSDVGDVVEGRATFHHDDQPIAAEHENQNDTTTTVVSSLLTPETVVAEAGDKAAIIKVRIMDTTSSSVPMADVAIISEENTIASVELPQGRGLNDAAAVILPNVKPIRIYSRPSKPIIRKFAYAEERSFHKGGQNTLVTTGDEQKLKKITRYRNSFKTRCRCARISHCPRIQITIHRCEQDYFMCCF